MKKNIFLTCILLMSVLCSSCGIIIINRNDGPTSDSSAMTDDDISVPTFESKDYPVESETDGREISEKEVEDLPDADFNGKSVFFAVAEETGDIFDEENGIYSQSVLYRNDLVNKKYNTKIITLKKSAGDLFEAVKKADGSGDYFADFAVVQYSEIGKYQAGSYLRNMKSLSFVGLSDECYNLKAMDQLNLGGKITGVVGNATEQIEHYSCIYFNKTLAEGLGCRLDYGKIYSGDFTWECFLEILKNAGSERPVFVTSNDRETLIGSSFFSSGQTYLSSDGEGMFELSCNNETSSSLIAYLKELIPMITEEIKFEGDPVINGNDAGIVCGSDIFVKGLSLTCFGTLDMAESLADCGFRWEILPLPKVKAEDKTYSTSVAPGAPVITALASAENIDTAGYILRALNTASFGYLKYEFYRNAEKNIITGVNTLDMIDLVCENPIYDHASMFGPAYKGLREGTYGAFIAAAEGSRTFEYYLSKKASGLEKYLSSIR